MGIGHMAEEDEGFEGADWAMGAEGVDCLRGLTGLIWLLYIVIWLEHHGKRLRCQKL